MPEAENTLVVITQKHRFEFAFDGVRGAGRNLLSANVTNVEGERCKRTMEDEEIERLFRGIGNVDFGNLIPERGVVQAEQDIVNRDGRPITMEVEGGFDYHDLRISELIPDDNSEGPQHYVGDGKVLGVPRIIVTPTCNGSGSER
jgi:hypothetical protein